MIEQPLDQGAAPVTDRREKPRIAIPRNIQTWVLAGGAVIVILAIAVSNAPGRSSRDIAAPAQTKQTLDPARLADFKKQLAAIDESARHEPAAKMPGLEQRPSPPRQAVQQDQRLTDQQRREEDSLFSSNIVATRRTGASQPIGSTGSAKQPGRDRQVAGPPSLDETAEAVVRASQRTGVPVTLPGVQPETPATPKPPAIASGPVPHQPVRTPPIDAQGPIHTLLEGTIVDAVLTNRLDGSSASPVNAMVTNPVYSHNGARILIPAGARVLGETKPVQNFGETRLAVSFHRLIQPDGSTVSLEQFKGLNQAGDNGVHDQVNSHYLSTFGASAAVGLIAGLGQAVGTRGLSGSGNNRTTVIAGDIGNSTSQASTQVMNRFLNRLPTITIREGHRLKVYITSDLDLSAYPTKEGTR